MSSNATLGVETRSRKRKRECRDANTANAGEAIPDLPDHLVVTHVLRPEYFDDPADLARLPAVSHAMRDAMASMGLRGTPLNANTCSAAAEGGHLEVLQWARANERLPVEHVDVRERGIGRAPRGAAVGTRERLPWGTV
eukprot:CAMPEP_0119223784 /NCGR_PEP_ID=MMETSP1327-20130426/33338_1 /TAXON_ID=38833 /ORGANISM="Micromonas pusilla, Strain RCC2306" /LENGTH=138 /DNA_ID=CAMNT_0007222061 /DNA_START=788 /DNA_END=1204 /DNA_ORIENTATION=+